MRESLEAKGLEDCLTSLSDDEGTASEGEGEDGDEGTASEGEGEEGAASEGEGGGEGGSQHYSSRRLTRENAGKTLHWNIILSSFLTCSLYCLYPSFIHPVKFHKMDTDLIT